MDKRYAIFDMDGTLVDSMAFWQQLAIEFLECQGISPAPPAILEQIKPMTQTQSAALFIRTFGLEGTPESVAVQINAMMEKHYRRDVSLKPGVGAYLQRLWRQGVRMCVASATAEPLMEVCLIRLGVRDRFQFLLSCESVGAGKDSPAVYHEAARRLAAAPAEIAVYEDALYAARTAKEAGFYVVGVYDESAASSWDELKLLADEAIVSFS